MLHRHQESGELGPWPEAHPIQLRMWPSLAPGPSPPQPHRSRDPCPWASRPVSPAQRSMSEGLGSVEGPLLFVSALVPVTSWSPEEKVRREQFLCASTAQQGATTPSSWAPTQPSQPRALHCPTNKVKAPPAKCPSPLMSTTQLAGGPQVPTILRPRWFAAHFFPCILSSPPCPLPSSDLTLCCTKPCSSPVPAPLPPDPPP